MDEAAFFLSATKNYLKEYLKNYLESAETPNQENKDLALAVTHLLTAVSILNEKVKGIKQ